jgi:hypothetical protein
MKHGKNNFSYILAEYCKDDTEYKYKDLEKKICTIFIINNRFLIYYYKTFGLRHHLKNTKIT